MKNWRFLLICTFCLVIGVLFFAASNFQPVAQAATPRVADSDVLKSAQSQGSARVLVHLHAPLFAAGEDETDAIAALQRSVLDSLPPDNVTLLHQFRTLPAFAGLLTPEAIATLQSNPAVASITLDLPGGAHLAESVTAMRADIVSNTYGITGAGVTVAILDTGIDTTHVDLADSIIGQQCFTDANCQPGNVDQSNSAQDLNGHGTHVSGIVTGNGEQAPHGFATNAKIVAVRVLDQSSSGWVSDWIAGLDWLNANYATTPVDIVNMSLGTFTLFPGNCDANQPTLAAAISNLRAKGVVIFASSGNQGSSTTIAAPACNSGVIAVGATYDSNVGRQPSSGSYASFFGSSADCFDASTALNKITCFTNSNSQVDILAPGAPIISTRLGGTSTTYYGTSQASPTAAAIAALMLEKDPSLTPDEIESLLKSSGIPVTDARNSLVIPRISAITAVNAVDFYNHIAPTSATISGASSGMTNSDYSFTATVSPISSTLPITYFWEASGTTKTYLLTDDSNSTVIFNWQEPGTQTITVTAENAFGLVMDSHTIELSAPNTTVPIAEVVLDGAVSGLVDRSYAFSATVSPLDASLPITYHWQVDGQAPLEVSGGRQSYVDFTWSEPGIYSLTVSATNASGGATSNTLQIQIKSAAPQSISLKGPASGEVAQSLTFLTSVLPTDAQTPMTYTWSATDQPLKVRTGNLNDNLSFSWQAAGVYTVAVKAENVYGTVTASRQVVINQPGVVVPLDSVTLVSPASGFVDDLLTFTATVSPPNATQPITYQWQPFGQPVSEQVTGNSTSFSLSWPQTGTFPITVTARNASGMATAQGFVVINRRSQPALSVIIDVPSEIRIGVPVTFTATVSPSAALRSQGGARSDQPAESIEYLWTATDQVPITHIGEFSDQVTFNWNKAGNITVKVEVTTATATVTSEKKLEVQSPIRQIYLPMIAR